MQDGCSVLATGKVAVVKKRMTKPRPPQTGNAVSVECLNRLKVVKPISRLLVIPKLHTHQLINTTGTHVCYDFNLTKNLYSRVCA